MCGIAAILDLEYQRIPNLQRQLAVMDSLQQHRGPDGHGSWVHDRAYVGFSHRRLSIIDLVTGQQPMTDRQGNWIVCNGEIYNYLELRTELGVSNFITNSDTEVILRGYRRWGERVVEKLRGMFSFVLWDEAEKLLFCARDRFGIKPFYYTMVGSLLYIGSEAKVLLPFLPKIETDREAFKDYLAFQLCLAGKTLFQGVNELMPGHILTVKNGHVLKRRYWEVYYNLDFDHTDRYFEERLRELLVESVELHLRSDVPLGVYVSGGMDSSTIASLAHKKVNGGLCAFNGKFSLSSEYDESFYARELSSWCGFPLQEVDITVNDFAENMRRVIYHMDYPVAGPGSFAQFIVARLVSKSRRVVLGGQGADEVFGGYSRYLIAYFEQCVKAAIDDTSHSGNFVVTYESIIPNLRVLKHYKPLLQEFWREGLFDDMDRRYFRLINRAPQLTNEINWELLGEYSPFETFSRIFNGHNVRKESYFDLMTHFDFKTLLPALLQVEDRVSMAHGLESRVPLLDHPLVELAATIPSNIKFKNGNLKYIFHKVVKPFIPNVIYQRQEKMGFPIPLTEWIQGGAREFVFDVLSSTTAKNRSLINNERVLESMDREPKFGRTVWGLLCLELWQQEFHDRSQEYRNRIWSEKTPPRATDN